MNFSSDSDTSPAFPSADYLSMMQQNNSDDQLENGLTITQDSPLSEQVPNGVPYSNGATSSEQFNHAMPQHLSAAMFDNPQDLNRRTLTQEQFDTFAQIGGIMDSSGHFQDLQHTFSGDADIFQQMFPDVNQSEYKSQDLFAFPAHVGAPLPSNDSSVPSTISEQSMFPSSTTIQDHNGMSAASSNWADSRSSSISNGPSQEGSYHQVSPPQPQVAATCCQWQPGQSVPIDPNELQQQFREAAQRSGQQQPPVHHEQPLAWPTDEAFIRRESQNSSMLTQQMSSFAIQTPQPAQTATFKTPAPPGEATSSIAARRQRPRPAALGLASLRSQSYSGAVPPISPSQQSHNLVPGQQLRRIRSSNVINGVAQGRVMKSTPGSAQRSPLSWNFTDAVHSPKLARHAPSGSVGNLAPPTPRSPNEQSRSQFPPWQTSSGHFSRQTSISETDAEYHTPTMPTTGAPAPFQNAASPPHTPMYHHHHQFYPQQQPLAQHRIANHYLTENTPPQSAPAAQQTFPADCFMLPQQQSQVQLRPQTQQFVSASLPEQHFHVPASTYGPTQQFATPVPESQPQMHIQFANGVPMVDAQGNLTMAFPPQMQQVQFVQHAPPQVQAQQPQSHLSQQQPPSLQGGQYNFITTSGATAGLQVTAHVPKQLAQQSTEFFVHEYSPPQEIRRSATQRRITTDSVRKNYTFANQGPEHFEKEKPKRGQDAKSSTASSSPASAASS